MRKHLQLDFRKFANAISPESLSRYLDHLKPNPPPSAWATINPDVLQQFLDKPENVEIRGVVWEEFRRINDICASGMALVVSAYERFAIAFDGTQGAEELAMLLFLDH